MSEDTELPRGIALAWGVAANPQRGPKREMSVERIVEAAVELADAEGIGAVSMAAVAKKLGFTPMSLYRYVSAKDDLLLLMQEEATGMPSLAYRDVEGWRAKLGVLFVEQVAIYLRHPWILALPITGSPVTPNSSHWIEAGLEAVDALSLSLDDKLSVVLAVTGAARWQGMVHAGYDAAARGNRPYGRRGRARREPSVRARHRCRRVPASARPHRRWWFRLRGGSVPVRLRAHARWHRSLCRRTRR